MNLVGYFALSIVSIFIISNFDSTWAQNSSDISEPVILSGDLLNDPVAQDILKKIELTKKWIEELNEKEYEKLKAQELLEEKRRVALEKLNEDLAEWEKLWEYYSSKNAFERFVAKKPEEVRGVFWDAFEFKEIKVQAGKEALKNVIQNGGNLREARQAYHKAAETKRIELIEQNNKFNVEHNLALYKQQILFDSSGKFIRTPEAKEKLREMYPDYKTSPAYLAANPQDRFAQSYTPEEKSVNKTDTAAEKEQEIENKIIELNNKFTELTNDYNINQVQIKDHYDSLYQKTELEAKQNEKAALANYNSNQTMTKKEISNQIIYIRNLLTETKEKILEQKNDELTKLQNDFENKTRLLVNAHDDSLDIKIIWNWESKIYQAIRK